jgi:hypothetical protein
MKRLKIASWPASMPATSSDGHGTAWDGTWAWSHTVPYLPREGWSRRDTERSPGTQLLDLPSRAPHYVHVATRTRPGPRVLLSSFHHPPPDEQPRALDRKDINRLKAIFREQGFQRKDPQNHVPVLLSEHVLRLALQQSNVQKKDMINHPADTPSPEGQVVRS